MPIINAMASAIVFTAHI